LWRLQSGRELIIVFMSGGALGGRPRGKVASHD
jgi:hypothetical protein